MHLPVRMALLAALLVATANALFTPRCLWSGLLGDSDSASSGESGERWLRDTSYRTKDSRVRRFLWTDKDVCDWMCKGDYGSEVREVCSRCCPGSTPQPSATSRRPRPASSSPPSTPGTSRAPRSTVPDGTEGTEGPTGTTATGSSAAATPAAASDAPTAAPAATPAAVARPVREVPAPAPAVIGTGQLRPALPALPVGPSSGLGHRPNCE